MFLEEKLSTKKASITCSSETLNLPLSQWKYGPLRASIVGEVPFDQKNKYNLGLTSSVWLPNVSSSQLNVEGKLPFDFTSGELSIGELLADLTLQPFPLFPIGSILGTPMSGTVSAEGQITGPLSALKSNLLIGLVNPQMGGVRLREEWRGAFMGQPGGGGDQLALNGTWS